MNREQLADFTGMTSKTLCYMIFIKSVVYFAVSFFKGVHGYLVIANSFRNPVISFVSLNDMRGNDR